MEEPEQQEEQPAKPPRRSGKILLPGGGAYGAQPDAKKPADTPPAEPDERAAGKAGSEGEPPAVEAPSASTGDLFWNGRIYKNGRIRISVENQTTAGYVEGDALPGVAVTVDARSPIVEILEQPSARNGYKSFEFQVKKSRKEPVSLHFHWMLKR